MGKTVAPKVPTLLMKTTADKNGTRVQIDQNYGSIGRLPLSADWSINKKQNVDSKQKRKLRVCEHFGEFRVIRKGKRLIPPMTVFAPRIPVVHMTQTKK